MAEKFQADQRQGFQTLDRKALGSQKSDYRSEEGSPMDAGRGRQA